MGSSSSKKPRINNKEYIISTVSLGELWDWGNRVNCYNCKTLPSVVSCNSFNRTYYINYNYCSECLYFQLLLRSKAISSIDVPIEVKQMIFNKFIILIT